MKSKDPLDFEDTKRYKDRLKEAQKKTDLYDAVRCAVGESKGREIVIACMDFDFIGGSMGSVVGEKIARGIDYAIKNRLPFMMISKSGGARMMEAAFSLMQMAKTSAKLAQLDDAGLPYVSLCTDPSRKGNHWMPSRRKSKPLPRDCSSNWPYKQSGSPVAKNSGKPYNKDFR